jgi:hypothetical protein
LEPILLLGDVSVTEDSNALEFIDELLDECGVVEVSGCTVGLEGSEVGKGFLAGEQNVIIEVNPYDVGGESRS